MDTIPVLPGAELEFTDFARSKKELVNRISRLRQKKPSLDRLQIAQNITTVYDAIGGPVSHARWAQENPSDFYRQYAKLAPAQTDMKVKGEFVIRSPLPRNAAIDGEFTDGSELPTLPSTEGSGE